MENENQKAQEGHKTMVEEGKKLANPHFTL